MKRSRPELEALRQRKAPLDMAPGEFREIGHRLVDQIADRLATAAGRPGDAATNRRRSCGGCSGRSRRCRQPAPTPAA